MTNFPFCHFFAFIRCIFPVVLFFIKFKHFFVVIIVWFLLLCAFFFIPNISRPKFAHFYMTKWRKKSKNFYFCQFYHFSFRRISFFPFLWLPFEHLSCSFFEFAKIMMRAIFFMLKKTENNLICVICSFLLNSMLENVFILFSFLFCFKFYGLICFCAVDNNIFGFVYIFTHFTTPTPQHHNTKINIFTQCFVSLFFSFSTKLFFSFYFKSSLVRPCVFVSPFVACLFCVFLTVSPVSRLIGIWLMCRLFVTELRDQQFD